MLKILVTGGCGFIGSHVVDYLLEKNQEVFVIDDLSLGKDHWINKEKRPKLFINDILKFDNCNKIFNDVKPDTVIHLAAHHYIPFCEKNIYDAYNLNIVGTLNILELCRKHSVQKFFFASTGDVYPPNFVSHREVDLVSPIYIYGYTKYLAEQMVIKYFEAAMPEGGAIIGRLFNAAGPRETNPHLLPEVVKQIVGGKRIIEVGNLWPKRDFVDVKSMAAIIADLTISVEGIDIVNIGSGYVQEVGKALEILISVLPFKVEVVSVPERQRPNDRPYLCPDVTRLNKLLGRVAKPFDISTAKSIFVELGIV